MTKIEKNVNVDFYKKVIQLLKEARKSVVQTVNKTMVYTYFEIGRIIVEEEQKGKTRAEYGKKILEGLSERLSKEFGRGFSVDNLENMRRFYLTYSISEKMSRKSTDEKSETVSRISDNIDFQLSWSHYLFLIRIDNPEERKFYEIEAINNNWSLRELQRQFDTVLFERLVLSRDKKDVKKLSEKGQMQMYVNYYDRKVKLEHENKTVGIILCKKKNETLVEMTLPENNEQIFASKYQTVLPSKEELKQLIENKEE